MIHVPKLLLCLFLFAVISRSSYGQAAALPYSESLPNAPQPEASEEVTIKGTPLSNPS